MKTAILSLFAFFSLSLAAQSWTADNGNGTFTNPLFYDEFSDPDLIRVGSDYYLAGTTMHAVPGLVVLHSRDLVNWEFLSYCFDRFDMGDEFALRGGKEAYGQGIWAPCIRYHNGTFYVFSNINGHGLQVFTAHDPRGPWVHHNIGGKIYDLSVLFDDDGKIYAVYKYNEVHLVELKSDLTGVVPGSERVIIPAGNAMGEGHHIYKVRGKYYIISANYSPVGRMQCARADRPEGPYETTVISCRETFGTQRAHSVQNVGFGPLPSVDSFDYKIGGGSGNYAAAVPLHQGGIVDTPDGEWWGFSMSDFRAVGRTTCLSPVTWHDGWPFFGLPGNLGRTPRTWLKPSCAESITPHAPYQRSDDFNAKTLLPVWQWNHEPVARKWALAKGRLALSTQSADNFIWAKNTLTQRCIGPVSVATVYIDATKLKDGDRAGLGILNVPYVTLGIERAADRSTLTMRIPQAKTEVSNVALTKGFLRCVADLDRDSCEFFYSTNGKSWQVIGPRLVLGYQLKTFQGPRFALYAYNAKGHDGGTAYFDDFTVAEPLADRTANLPIGRVITLRNKATGQYAWANPHGMLHSASLNSKEYKKQGCFFKVHDRGQGRVALEAMNGTGFLTVTGAGLSADVRLMPKETEASLFMWQDMLRGDCQLLSLKTNRYVGLDPETGEPYGADFQGCRPDRRDGTVFAWQAVSHDGKPQNTAEQYTY